VGGGWCWSSSPDGRKPGRVQRLAALDVHPRVAMAILRHSRVALTMEIYTQVPDKVTRDALRRLSDQLDSDQADEDKPDAAGPGQPGIE
jgi:hypothetical protein